MPVFVWYPDKFRRGKPREIEYEEPFFLEDFEGVVHRVNTRYFESHDTHKKLFAPCGVTIVDDLQTMTAQKLAARIRTLPTCMRCIALGPPRRPHG